jgi:tetratricopeptide (TPR) repeat protein
MISAWLVTATALYSFIRYNGSYSDVRFSHIAGLPFTLKAYRQAKGEFFLKQGLDAANENRWRDAFDLLQLGLPTQPNNEEARLILARIYLMAQRPDQAKAVFLEGLEYRTDKQADYIRTVLSFLFNQQADSTVVEVANSLLAREGLSEDIRKTLLIARLYAHFNRDRFGDARKSIQGTPLQNSPQATFIDIRIDWERGLRESAVVSLTSLQARHPEDDELYRTLQTYLREQGRRDEARRLALERQLAFPSKSEAYLDFIRLCGEDGMETRRLEATEDFLRLFGQDLPSLLRLQVLAAQFGWSELAWRLLSLIPTDKPRERNTAAALAIESDLARKAYASVEQRVSEWLKKDGEFTATERALFIGLEGLAYYGRSVEAEGTSRLERVLSSGMVSSTTLAALGQHVQAMGKLDMAERFFARAIEVDPLNTSALVALLQLKQKTRQIDESLDLVERLPLVLARCGPTVTFMSPPAKRPFAVWKRDFA